jgi:hypothetical protein
LHAAILNRIGITYHFYATFKSPCEYRSLSAQFEHSVGVTATGVEIFTLSERHGEKQIG